MFRAGSSSATVNYTCGDYTVTLLVLVYEINALFFFFLSYAGVVTCGGWFV